MVKMTIDGQSVEAEEGKTILEVAQGLGIQIPTLCYYRAISPYAACRVCLVEIADQRGSRLVASCAYPVEDGLDVKTTSRRVLDARKVVVELLIARCEKIPRLQALADQLGVEEPEFKDDEDCILCGLCARVCGELMGVGAVNFEGRGPTRRVTTPFDEISDVCLGCGACAFVCPTGARAVQLERITGTETVSLLSEFDEGLDTRPSIYIPFAQAVPHKPVIDADTCARLQIGECGACEAFCDAQAIVYDQEDTIQDIEVGTIIVATGFDLFDTRQIARYGYGRLKNVLHSLEFERLSHASGPTDGKIVTADGCVPQSVAIIHCVGSRDENYHEYCSRVCCMYSLKFAHLVKEKTGAEVYNLYIDMRTPGKGYEEFYKRLLREDVHFIRGKCAEVTDVAESKEEEGKLVVICEDTLLGVTRRLSVDMVILSAALQPRSDVDEVARMFSLNCAQGNFFLEKHPKLAPVEAASDGIYLAGACQGPKDIPDSVAQGAAAAACSLSLMDAGHFVLEPITAEIDPELCSGCRICLASCPFEAIEFDEEKQVSVVREELCKGCGTCVATCPSGVAKQKGFADVQIFAEMEGILA